MGNDRITEVYCSVISSSSPPEVFLINSSALSQLALIFQLACLLLSWLSADTMVKLHNHLIRLIYSSVSFLKRQTCYHRWLNRERRCLHPRTINFTQVLSEAPVTVTDAHYQKSSNVFCLVRSLAARILLSGDRSRSESHGVILKECVSKIRPVTVTASCSVPFEVGNSHHPQHTT